MFLVVVWKVFSRRCSSDSTASLERVAKCVREVLQERTTRQETNPLSRSSDGRTCTTNASMFAGSNSPQFNGEPRCYNVGGNYSVDNTTIVLNVLMPNEQSSWKVCDVLLVFLVVVALLVCLVAVQLNSLVGSAQDVGLRAVQGG
ncbi:hypothetical protein M378DRAFT_171573 [Amanita muscaria Koide BX008]|uniref:Uncharacterized protein n=1 Tax=Amanita muscaria (strain Koide BX008) TaxID=946122 RepID=A0A0C2W8W7_AMAMK|nr:hypothetical protein M378DRAFT_171573 [Amanita muscaria Koide BX008]